MSTSRQTAHQIISDRAKSITPSYTVKISTIARALQREGNDVIDLGIGEPDIPAPDAIKQAVANYATAGHKIYSDICGTPELLQAVIATMARDYDADYTISQVMGFDGGKVALDRVIETIINPGDEVILSLPAWVSYEPQIAMAGGIVKTIKTTIENRFKIQPQQLQNIISDRTKAIILCPLNNPTSTAYTADELAALGEVLKKHPDIWIISDDLYQHLHFKNNFPNILTVCPYLKSRTIIINGTTKSHSWRFGFLATECEEIISSMAKIQSHRSGHPNLETQAGAIQALKMGPVLASAESFRVRHDMLLPLLQKGMGWKVIPGDGAFYFFVNVEESMQQLKIDNDIEYAMQLLQKANVATVPGSAFGYAGYLRLSFCQSRDRLMEAVERIHVFNNE